MKLFRLRTIRSRLLSALFLAVVGAVVIAVAVWSLSIRPALIAGVATYQHEVAKRASAEITDFIDKRISELLSAVEISRFWEMEEKGQKEALYRLMKLVPLVHEVSIADRGGQRISRLSRTAVYSDRDLTSVAEKESFRRAIQGEIYISEVYHIRTAEPFITLAVPIKFTAREIRGALIAEISLKTLWASISHIKVGQSGYGFVIDHKGYLIAHPDYSKVLLGLNMASTEEVKEFLSHPVADPEPGKIAIGSDGKKVVTSFAPVAGPHWAVIVEEPVETALAEVRRIENFAALLAFLILTGAFVISYWFSGRIARPIRTLERGAKLLSSGNLDYRLEVRTGDEVESLATEFNAMASALKQSYRGLEEKVSERTREITALYSALAPLAAADSIEDLLKGVIERVLEVTGADAALIRILDRETGILLCPARIGVSSEFIQATQRVGEDSAIRTAFATGEPIIAADIAADSRLKRKRQLKAGFVSCAFLPLRVKGELRGVIHLASRTLGHFNESKKEHLMAIARQMGIAMENRELFEEARTREAQLQETNRMLSALHSVAAAASQSLDLDRVVHAASEKIMELFRFDGTGLFVYDEKTKEFLLRVASAIDPERFVQPQSIPLGQGIVSKVVESGKPLIFEDVETDPLYQQLSRTKKARGLSQRFFAVFPVKGKQGNLGALTCLGAAPRRLNSNEIQLLESVADQIAVAIENSQLYDEMVKLAADLSRSNKVKDEFLSVMSHELRTPLNVVMGYTGMIKDGFLGEINPEQGKALEKVISRARDQLTMINGILTATQMEADKVKADIYEINLAGILDDLKSSCQVPAGKEFALRWDYAPDLPVVRTDEEKLKQILQNLLDNAIKFTSEGSVTVSARLTRGNGQQAAGDGQLEFTVKDTGIGIPEEYFPFIFERFHQVDSSETRQYGGVGIGLYIVKKFTELLGGKVEVESEVGKGSTFTVTIPCQS